MNRTKNTIHIDGKKLQKLLEEKTGMSIRKIATSNGFTENCIVNAVKENYASALIQFIAKYYGIYPDEYQVEEVEEEEVVEFTVEDILATGVEYNNLRFPEEPNELEKTLSKILTPLSIAIGVEVEKGIIDVLKNVSIEEHIDADGHYSLTFNTRWTK